MFAEPKRPQRSITAYRHIAAPTLDQFWIDLPSAGCGDGSEPTSQQRFSIMDHLRIEAISMQDKATQAVLLDLNNANARETSLLTPEQWQTLIGDAFSATCAPDSAALLIAFDQDADYHSPNFKWFRERLSRFVYVDRIIVARDHRGRGLASHMYRDLFLRAQSAEHDRVVCEVNLIPPNPGSDAFHSGMGFTEVGRANLVDSNKTVRYLEKRL